MLQGRTFLPLLLGMLLLASGVALPATPAAAATSDFAWGSDLSLWWSYEDAHRTPAIETAAQTGMPKIFTDAKTEHGLVNWATPDYPTLTTFSPDGGGVEHVVRDAHAKNVDVAARFGVFYDEQAAARFPHAAVGNTGWVDPGCADVRNYMLNALEDLVTRTGVDKVNLDFVRYPDHLAVGGSHVLPCTGGTLDKPTAARNEVIAEFVADARARIDSVRPGVVLSASVFAGSLPRPLTRIGQDGDLLAPHLDILMPMIYPAYLYPGENRDPYVVTHEFTSAAVQAYGGAKIQPWIDGETGVYKANVDLVCQQIRGAADAGASGAFVWWFPSMGTGPGIWSRIAECVPQPASTPAPEPAPEAFSADFSPKPGNEWWVETRLKANREVASVTVQVENGKPVALALTDWGTWAKSFHVPEGSTLRFTATADDGSTAESGTYR